MIHGGRVPKRARQPDYSSNRPTVRGPAVHVGGLDGDEPEEQTLIDGAEPGARMREDSGRILLAEHDEERTERAPSAPFAEGSGLSTLDEPTLEEHGKRPAGAPLRKGVARDPQALKSTRRSKGAKLIVESGNDSGREFALSEMRTTVGRGIDNHIVLTDIAVSRQHLTIEYDGQRFTIRDAGSGNGTLVNDIDHEGPYVLCHGDRLELGNTVFRFRHLGSMEPIAASPMSASPAAVSQPTPSPWAPETLPHDALDIQTSAPPPRTAPPAPRRAQATVPPPPPRAKPATVPPPPPRAPLPPPRLPGAAPRAASVPPPPSVSPAPAMAGGFEQLPMGRAASAPPVMLDQPVERPVQSVPPLSERWGGPVAASPAPTGMPHGGVQAFHVTPAAPARQSRKLVVGLIVASLGVVVAAIVVVLARSGGSAQPSAGPEVVDERVAGTAAGDAGARAVVAALPRTTWGTDEPAPPTAPEPSGPDEPVVPETPENTDDPPPDTPDTPEDPPEAPEPTPEPKPEPAIEKPTPKPEPRPVRKPTRTPKPNKAKEVAAARKKAFSQYQAGKFTAAARTLRGATAGVSRKESDALKALATDYEAVGRNIQQGNDNATRNPRNAMRQYQRAKTLDARRGRSAHAGLLRSKLANVAPRAAAAYFQDGRYTLAKSASDIAAANGAGNNSSVKNVRRELASKANELYKQALSARKDPTKAKSLLDQILKMVPPSSATYKKASAKRRSLD